MSKIIFITGKDPSVAAGGQASYVRAHAIAATQAGYEPHVFCPGVSSKNCTNNFGILRQVKTAQQILGIWPVKTPEFHKSFMPWQAVLMAPIVTRFVAANPDCRLIHGIATWGYVGLLARNQLHGQGINVALINSVYTTAEHESAGKLSGLSGSHSLFNRFRYHANHKWIKHVVAVRERQAYQGADTVVLNYENVRDLVHQEFGRHENIVKLPYTSEIAFRRQAPSHGASQVDDPRKQQPGRPEIVSVSRHDPRKGVDVLVNALARLKSEGQEFSANILSGGPLLEAHRRMATRLGVDDVVTFTGWVNDPWPYLQRADIFALPSLEEGSGSVSLIEAFEAGLAVVSSRLDGLPEDITHGENGWLVESGSVDALADGLRKLLEEIPLRKFLAGNSRRTFDERFSPDVLVSALGSLYQQCHDSL